MLISVRYGKNETLMCNSFCMAINLMKNISRRTGYDVTLDLSDETGLVKELDEHRYDYANKFLSNRSTYVLVQKHLIVERPKSGHKGELVQSIQYTPLLDNAKDMYPNLNLHVAESEQMKKKLKKKTLLDPSSSPAGKKDRATKSRGSGRTAAQDKPAKKK